MRYEKIEQMIKRLPMVLIGALVGSALMHGADQFPVLVEVNWSPEESYIRFDSRTEQWCEQQT